MNVIKPKYHVFSASLFFCIVLLRDSNKNWQYLTYESMPESTLPMIEGYPHLPKLKGGKYSVGYVDVFSPPRTEEDGVLFRLFYPSNTTSDNPRKWGNWFPDIRYAEVKFWCF